MVESIPLNATLANPPGTKIPSYAAQSLPGLSQTINFFDSIQSITV